MVCPICAAKTPAPIVQKLNAEFVKALQSVEVRDKVLPQAFSVMPTTPDELGAIVAPTLCGSVRL